MCASIHERETARWFKVAVRAWKTNPTSRNCVSTYFVYMYAWRTDQISRYSVSRYVCECTYVCMEDRDCRVSRYVGVAMHR